MFNPINIFSKLIKSSNQRELDRVQKIIKDISDELDFVKNKFKAQERKKQDKEWKL